MVITANWNREEILKLIIQWSKNIIQQQSKEPKLILQGLLLYYNSEQTLKNLYRFPALLFYGLDSTEMMRLEEFLQF